MTKYPCKGGIVKVAATVTPTNVLAGLIEVALVGGERDEIPTDSHDDTVVKSWLPHPVRNIRGLEVTHFYDPADTQHERIRAAYEAGTLEYETLVLPDAGAAQWAFSGYVMSWELQPVGQDGALQVKYVFRAVGNGTFTQ